MHWDIYLFFLYFYILNILMHVTRIIKSSIVFLLLQELLCCSFGEQKFALHSVMIWFQKYLIFLPLEY